MPTLAELKLIRHKTAQLDEKIQQLERRRANMIITSRHLVDAFRALAGEYAISCDVVALTGKPVNDPKVADPVICNQGDRRLMENENINKADKDVLNRIAHSLQMTGDLRVYMLFGKENINPLPRPKIQTVGNLKYLKDITHVKDVVTTVLEYRAFLANVDDPNPMTVTERWNEENGQGTSDHLQVFAYQSLPDSPVDTVRQSFFCLSSFCSKIIICVVLFKVSSIDSNFLKTLMSMLNCPMIGNKFF
ncbi:hypothetical protein GCK72_023124 [Caenorhabditis remanei]|uniref:Uncharacterized protein n=1 Tax=Caenorhabditis remanei TaxID=31234 RepID=A0A6A5FVT1_CAERE|nr:hypothetical protein GCK72_023124 [Caenorhabditis remanei]KAF1746667.1 hypothetical protein GCK72_023124 [Caenorhabditis remanei]